MTAVQDSRAVVGGLIPRRISKIETLTDDSVAVTFGADGREGGSFVPGQHVTVRRHFDDEEVRRTYSICTLNESDDLRIGVRRIQGGRMSTWLTESARVGDLVDVGAPTGDFGRHSPEAAGSHIVLIGAGSGVTPLLSIAAQHLDAHPKSSAFLLLANRSGSSVMLAEDLAGLKDRFTDRLQLVHVLSREQRGVPIFKGRLDEDRITKILEWFGDPRSVAQWFLCGPREMVDAGRQAAARLGADPGDVHRELFFADAPSGGALASAPLAPAPGTVVVTLNGQTTTLVGEEIQGSILDALLTKRSDAPFACKSGVCGTCRARCATGEVQMTTNYALEDAELASGLVLTCQARPASDHVELEFL